MIQDKIAAFFAQYPLLEYHKGDILIFAQMKVSSVYYIETGVVLEYDIAASGDRVILNSFKKGAFFPMSHVVNDVETPYFFEAEDTVRVREVPAERAHEFIKDNPDVLYDLLQRTYRGTDGLLAKLSAAMHDDAKNRILRELEIMALRFGATRSDGAVRLKRKVTKVQLAERTGLARETVSRTLKQLASEEKVRLDEGYYVLLTDSVL